MLNFLKPTKKYEPDNGCFLAANSEYFDKIDIVKELSKSENNILILNYYHPNTFYGLKEIINDDIDIISNDIYNCPYTEMEFFRTVPDFIITKNIEFYRSFMVITEVMKDKEWSLRFLIRDNKFIRKPGKILRAMLGTGYDFGCMENDGFGEIVPVTINLSNDDLLVCWTWLWFNK